MTSNLTWMVPSFNSRSMPDHSRAKELSKITFSWIRTSTLLTSKVKSCPPDHLFQMVRRRGMLSATIERVNYQMLMRKRKIKTVSIFPHYIYIYNVMKLGLMHTKSRVWMTLWSSENKVHYFSKRKPKSNWWNHLLLLVDDVNSFNSNYEMKAIPLYYSGPYMTQTNKNQYLL